MVCSDHGPPIIHILKSVYTDLPNNLHVLLFYLLLKRPERESNTEPSIYKACLFRLSQSQTFRQLRFGSLICTLFIETVCYLTSIKFVWLCRLR